MNCMLKLHICALLSEWKFWMRVRRPTTETQNITMNNRWLYNLNIYDYYFFSLAHFSLIWLLDPKRRKPIVQSICGLFFFSKLTFIWFLSIHKCLCSQFYYRCCCCCCSIEWYIYQMKIYLLFVIMADRRLVTKFWNAFNFYLTNETNQWASQSTVSSFQLHTYYVYCIILLYYESELNDLLLLAKWKLRFSHTFFCFNWMRFPSGQSIYYSI